MSNAPITVVDQNWRKRGSSRNTEIKIMPNKFVMFFGRNNEMGG